MGDLTETDHDVAGKVYILDQDTLVIDEFSFDNNGFGVYINVATKGRNKKQWAKNRIDVPYPSGGLQPLGHCSITLVGFFLGGILQLWYQPEHWLSSFVLFSERLYQRPPSVYQKDDVVDSGTEGEPIEKLYKGDGQLIIDLKQVKTFSFWQEKPPQES